MLDPLFARKTRGERLGSDYLPCDRCRDVTEQVVIAQNVRQKIPLIPFLFVTVDQEALLYCARCGQESVMTGFDAERLLRSLKR